MMQKLGKGDQFPEIELMTVNDGKLVLPSDIATPHAFILFYRGHW